jgi:hypothetical protein
VPLFRREPPLTRRGNSFKGGSIYKK